MSSVKLTDLLPLPVKVNLGRGEVEVSGWSMEDISKILLVYKEELIRTFTSKTDDVDFTHLVVAAPQMAADLVGLAIGMEDQVEDIRKMPATLQIEILAEAWKITAPDPKKLGELLSGVLATLKGSAPQVEKVVKASLKS
jgi:hypothetical protein